VVTVRSSGDPAALLAAIEASIGSVERSRTTDGALEIYVAGVDRLVPRIVEAVDVAGLEIADLQVAVPTLESVFIALTGKELRDE
jgi:ABC-2 type transport system ATP-binding protein